MAALSSHQHSNRGNFFPWIIFLLVFGVLFIGTNLWITWISTNLIPFSTSINLSKSGEIQEFKLENFFSTEYFLYLDFKISKNNSPDSGLDLFQKKKQATELCEGVLVQIQISDEKSNEVYNFTGPINQWILTTSDPFRENSYSFYSQNHFEASSRISYNLRIEVKQGKGTIKNHSPILFFYGIDDGYFWAWRPYSNIGLAILTIFLGFLLSLKFPLLKLRDNETTN